MRMGVGGGGYDGRLERLRKLRRHIDALELRFAFEAAEFAALPNFDDDLASSPVAVLRDECRMTAGAAAQAIAVGEEQPRIGFSTQALLNGQIGFRHLSLIAYTASWLTESPTALGFDEAPLLTRARSLSVKGLMRVCTAYRRQMDPAACLEEEREGAESRFLELKTDDETGALWLRGWLENESGALLKSALEPLSQLDAPDDHRPESRRRADALVEIVRRALDAGGLPVQGGVRPHLQVSATLDALAKITGAPAAELEHGLPISAEALRRHACDCSLVRVLLSGDSQVLDVGRAVRVIKPAQRRALLQRDRTCRFPGCERPGRYCDGHHLQHWAEQGETNLKNLVLICPRHHFLVHEGGWQLKGAVEGTLVAIPPKPWWLSDQPAA